MKPVSISRLVKELRRRRVFRGVIVYGASTLILLEAAQNICTVFGIEAVPRWFLLLLVIGLFLSLWFSWIYDITPGGIKKTEPVSEQSVPIPKKEVTIYKTTTLASVFIIIGLFSYRIIDRNKDQYLAQIEKSIAVLPLTDEERFSEEYYNYQFIGHEITTCLLKVRDYRVVPWEKCRQYPRAINDSYTKMGQDLSAAILVNWRPHESGGEKYLSVDLISVVNESQLWGESYKIEGDWASEICRYSREISKKITKELRTSLTPKERAKISEEPVSANAAMYASLGAVMARDSWEQALTSDNNIDTMKSDYIDAESFEKAISYFDIAIKEDPLYALAYANRAKTRLWGMRSGYLDHVDLAECESDILKAFDLEADLPEAHIALGFYYYYGLEEYLMALTSFEKAVVLEPGRTEYQFYLSVIQRALGNWKEVKNFTDQVYDSAPRNALFQANMGTSYLYLHEFQKSLQCQDLAIRLLPHWYVPYLLKVQTLLAMGNVTVARSVITGAEKETGRVFYMTSAMFDLYEGDLPGAIENVEKADLSEFREQEESTGDRHLLMAKIYRLIGDSRKSVSHYNSAIAHFQDLVLFNPDDPYGQIKLGIAQAGIGENKKAREQVKCALDASKSIENASPDPDILYRIIQLYTMVGDLDSSKQYLEALLLMNSPYTSDFLKLDPDLKQLF
jgi:tetratricopeptide (TPR) repeat protein